MTPKIRGSIFFAVLSIYDGIYVLSFRRPAQARGGKGWTMASKISASFFDAKNVAFVGYSKRHAGYCASIRDAFIARGSSVYPVNPNPGDFDIKVYASILEIPGSPELAVVITKISRNPDVLPALAAKGVKRVIFGSSVSADQASLDLCSKLGMEAAIVCPLQAIGKGFHRFHGWIAGVPRVGVA